MVADGERLQKYLARAGVDSRRKCEQLIIDGRVKVNERIVDELGARVRSGDTVSLDGIPVEPGPREYHLLNKPMGVLSAASDARGGKTVTEMVPSELRLFPVGRLDRDTTGLLLLTNDGELAHRLMHPRFEVDKVYRVEVEGRLDEIALERLRAGIELEDGLTSPAEVRRVRSSDDATVIEMTIHEGRKRQVRRMLEAVGHPVISLHRSRYAILTDKGLELGESRALSEKEVKHLKDMIVKGAR